MKKADIICFSPTGNTRAVCGVIQKALENIVLEIKLFDITNPDVRKNIIKESHCGELLIIAFPVYSQSAAEISTDFIKKTSLTYEKAVVICTYGGISCAAAVWNVVRILDLKNIPCIAVAEIPLKHNFTYNGIIGLDNTKIYDFTSEINDFIINCCVKSKSNVIKPRKKFYIASLFSQKKLIHMAVYAPKTMHEFCNGCNNCIAVCPVCAIKNDLTTDKKSCIGCTACIMACPSGARKLVFKSIIPVLYLKHGIKKSLLKQLNPKFYI